MILGIDIGTTNVKCIVYDSVNNRVCFEGTIAHDSSVPSVDGKREQNVATIFTALQELVAKCPELLRSAVTGISICGQMHGVCLWNENCWRFNHTSCQYTVAESEMYNLVTWEDGRCDPLFLNSLPKSCIPLSSGFGCATLCWLACQESSVLQRFRRCGTVMDFVVSLLTDSETVTTSTQLAYSWGYYDLKTNQWQKNVLEHGFSNVASLLPDVRFPKHRVGNLNSPWLGIPSTAAVNVGLGDFQCSVFAAQKKSSSARQTNVIFNFGTGCQLALPLSLETNMSVYSNSHGLGIWPYFDSNAPIAVAASLNGGNVLSFLVNAIREFISSLQIGNITEQEIWGLIQSANFDDSSFNVCPSLFGERHMPSGTLSVLSVTPSSRFSISHVLSSVCHGLIRNIVSFYPPNYFEQLTDAELICVGKAFKLPIMREAIRKCFSQLHVNVVDDVNSALGAAFSFGS